MCIAANATLTRSATYSASQTSVRLSLPCVVIAAITARSRRFRTPMETRAKTLLLEKSNRIRFSQPHTAEKPMRTNVAAHRELWRQKNLEMWMPSGISLGRICSTPHHPNWWRILPAPAKGACTTKRKKSLAFSD
jgi:hypothetical protein